MPQAAPSQPRIERQFQSLLQALEGKRVGFLTNPTSVDADYRHLADRLNEAPSVNLICFFAPEHGLRGEHQAGGGDADYTDPVTGLPVYSLYRTRTAPTDEQLETIDVLVFDIQDVGARFYTYVWTMTHAMEAAAKNGKQFVVFDRPNPIGLSKVEGAPITFNAGLIGRVWPGQPFGVATRHGLTAGELAQLVNTEWMDPKVDLTVIPVPEYSRNMSFEETGYPWVFPSPNMPTVDTAMVYTGMCVFEGASMSEGRGTTRPFELVGAPYIDATALADALNAKGLPGVRFRPAYFTPSFDNHSGEACGGIQVHVTDEEAFEPVRTGLHVLKMAKTMYPDQVSLTNSVSRLMGVENLQTRIVDEEVDDIIAGWQENMTAFLALREKHLIYPASQQDWSVK